VLVINVAALEAAEAAAAGGDPSLAVLRLISYTEVTGVLLWCFITTVITVVDVCLSFAAEH
jgi:hypothetical protein